ncbi:RNA polymerase II-associated [Gilbertella persicaria]|uniref:RNA polymerase II-associated n=1 Tax=Gilbertella persicaria TaxID=101096 RepID=UPI00221F3822|nr:RNA polymerase II-associated [Gilbertella persicaria]KAI8088094.1 RNA polymerase II-associated [Gilbertella persicaria]
MSSKSKFRSDYICRVRYRNTLPPVPYAPKMLTIPSLVERHVPYQSTSLVEQTPYSLIMDQSASIPFDKALVDYLDAMESHPEEVSEPMEGVAEEDKILMSEPTDGQGASGLYTRKPNVTWLRRSEYIAQETRGISNRKEGVENKFAMSAAAAKKRNYSTREEQIAGVENTFKPLPEDLRHPQTKSRAKKIIPLLPDTECWENIYTIGQFSTEPADEARMAKRRAVESSPGFNPSKRPRFSETDATDRGILRPMVNPHDPDDTYLVWFLPDAESTKRLVKQKEDPLEGLSEDVLQYHAVRDYEYKNDASNSKHLLLSVHIDDHGERVVYCPIRSKMVVRKKRAQVMLYSIDQLDSCFLQSAQFSYLDDYEKPNVLTVTYTKG